MRSHVRVLGQFQGIRNSGDETVACLALGSGNSITRVQMIIKASSQCRPDSGDLFEVGDAGAHHALQPSEVLQELPPLGRAQSRNGFEDRLVVAAGPLAPVTGDREAMRFVANALYQPRCRRMRLWNVGLGDAMHEEPF